MALAVAGALLAAADTWLSLSNQAMQAEAVRRQEFIAQTAQLARIDQAVAAALAEAAQRDANEPLRTLLSRNGIELRAAQVAAPAETQAHRP